MGDEREKPTTFRDDAKTRCPTCEGPAAQVLAGEMGKRIAVCAAGHAWEPGGETVRLGGRR